MVDEMKLLVEIQSIATGKRKVRNEHLLTMKLSPGVFQKYLIVEGVGEVFHISCVTNDMVWISDRNGQIILKNRKGTRMHILTDTVGRTGGHSVTPEGNLIYIYKYYNINKLSTDNKTLNTLVKSTEPWGARCVYCSPFNADLLIGMRRYERDNPTYTDAKVMRYNSTGQQIQAIHHDNTCHKLFKFPKYITENLNGDIIVLDLYHHAVVVTDRGGRHRFYYTGPTPKSQLSPQGICVDGLSHILVSDAIRNTVQMIDKEGNFLMMLFNIQCRINATQALGYDNRSHLLWAGTSDSDSTLCVYRYIYQRNHLI
ncbi:uncharacterized protein LOC133174789 [Saccostrea echinata]|uniref:uncharacterized protein LOC133174789 n=1 Tax=Saccostrea echinata TaxID=191078 RepID=UPI002A84163E|nr:uncharacterized protein LOC133174789 [Saccostrea echinata]